MNTSNISVIAVFGVMLSFALLLSSCRQPGNFSIEELSYRINQSAEQVAKPNGIIECSVDDQLSLGKLTFATELLFSVDPKFQSGLDDENDKTVSEDLRQEFGNNEISLSKDASVSIEEKGSRWRIIGENKTYLVMKEDDKLNIYATDYTKGFGIWAEAYIADGAKRGEDRIDYNNGLSTYGKDTISLGKNTLIFKPGSWIIKQSHDGFVVVLVHQFGKKDRDYEKVDRVFINLKPQQEE